MQLKFPENMKQIFNLEKAFIGWHWSFDQKIKNFITIKVIQLSFLKIVHLKTTIALTSIEMLTGLDQ